MKLKQFVKGIRVNQVIQFLTYSDILIMGGWGLVSPIIAVFITKQIQGGTVAVAGLATTIYFLTKSIVQIPLARFTDIKRGERDDYWTMVVGSLIISLCAFLFMVAKTPLDIYFIQVLHGLGGALSYPTWLAIFTRHTDKNQEGLQWSLYYTVTDLASALTAGLGGFLVSVFDYQRVFLVVGVCSLLGTLFLAGIPKYLRSS